MANLRPLDLKFLRELIPPMHSLSLLHWPGRREPCGQWRGPCPIHGSHSPTSRSLSVSDRYWYCHVCRRGGDAIQLWAEIHRVTVLEAAHELCQRLAIAPPYLA